MKKRGFVVILLPLLLMALTGNAQATPSSAPDPQSLIVIQIGSPEDLKRFASTQLPMYAMLEGALLTGADQRGQQSLQAAGLRFEVIDPNPGTGTYYLAETRASRKAIDFNLYGQVLFNTSQGVLLRMDPGRVNAMTQAGAEISLITLTPKPLPEVQEGTVFPDDIEPDPIVQQMIDQVQLNQVSYYDRQLAGELPVWVDGEWYTIATRNTYSGTPIQKTTSFVGQHMANDLDLDVEYHVWNNTTNPNVIGEIPGQVNPQNIFIIGAHIDDVNGTPGADDNASGSVATLLAADILSQYQWGCTLRFAFWTGEEQGLLGSSAYAQRAAQMDENIVGYLNLDMIAWNTIGSPPVINLFYTNNIPPTLQLAQLFADVVGAYNLNLIPVLGTGVTGSDHYPFWQQGFTSILAIEDDLGGDFNPYYHGPGDTPAHTDLTYFTNFVKASVGTYAHMTDCLLPSMGSLDGHVTAAAGGAPVEGATITADDGQGHSYTNVTNESGYYTQTMMTAGIYAVSASAYSYLPATVNGVEITTDTLTTQDFALTLAPTFVVSGTITEAGTGNPLLATISFIGSPVVVTSNPLTGFYQATLPEGAYTMQVRAELHGLQEREVIIDHNQTQDFALVRLPCILLVDDDQNNPNVRNNYTQALDSNGYDYSTWDVSTQGNPSAGDLAGYRQVMWFNGSPSSSTFTTENEAAVKAYLDEGGNFFLSSQEYLSERHLTTFGQNYLHIASYVSNVSQTVVFGQNAFAGIGPYNLTYPFANYSDTVTPDTLARVAFLGNHNYAAVSYDGTNFNTAFFAYPFEALPQSGRTVVMQRMVDGFFGGCKVPPAVSIVPSAQEGSGKPGTQVSYVYTVINLASSPQDVLLSISGNNWPTEAPTSTGELGSYASTTITVVVTIPNIPEGIIAEDSFTLTAEGTLGGTATATGTTFANVHPGVEVVSPADGFGQPSEVVNYAFSVTNTGDYTDSFTLQVSGAWTATLPGGNSTGPLAAGASTSVVVQVVVPIGAAEGDFDTTTLTAVSDLDSNVSASAEVTTTALVYDVTIAPAAQEKSGEPGTQVSYIYTVTNASSRAQGIHMSIASGWAATVQPESIVALDPGGSAIVSITVTIPTQLSALSDIFTLSAEGGVGGEAAATGITTADVTPSVGVEAPADGYGRPLEIVAYEFMVTNTGDYTDTFTLKVSGTWSATLPGGNDTGLLPAGESVPVLVLVVIPANASGGSTDVTTLTATSMLDDAIYAEAKVTTRVSYIHILPFIAK